MDNPISFDAMISVTCYIDPNTTHTVFNTGILVSLLGIMLNLLVWPILFLKNKITKLIKSSLLWRIIILAAGVCLVLGCLVLLYFILTL